MSENQLMERVERLEKSNRRLKLAGVVVGVGLAAWMLIGAERPPQPISGSEFRVVDPDGKLRAMIGADKDGTFFFLNDPDGKMRASIAAQKSGAYLNLKDEDGKTRAVISFDDSGPSLSLRDAGENLLAFDDKGPFLQIRDPGGKVRVIGTLSDFITDARKPEAPKP